MAAIIFLTTFSNYPSDLMYSCPRLTTPGSGITRGTYHSPRYAVGFVEWLGDELLFPSA